MGAAGSDMITSDMDMEQFKVAMGEENYNEEDFAALANDDGVITKETIKTMTAHTDCFLTHDWGDDELGRNNHTRVSEVNDTLKEHGLVPWFDSDRMEGNIMAQMCAGIDNASCVVVFITQRYMEKVGGANAQDNCKKEFNYAERRKTGDKMIPVVMEPRMRDTSQWSGPIGMVLGGQLYVDLSEDSKWEAGIAQLVKTIKEMAST
eukprot:gene25679-31012_t